jgi:hypothetical protein
MSQLGKNNAFVGASVVVTTTVYAGSTAIDMLGATSISFDVDFTKDTLTNIQPALQVSNDGSSWFTQVYPALPSTITATSKANLTFYPVKHRYARLGVLATGAVGAAVVTVSGYAGIA